jgi:hypothetical protein
MATAAAIPETCLDDLDEILAAHPFGNSDYITQRMHACYRRRLAAMSSQSSAAARLLGALESAAPHACYRTLGDSAVRCAIQHGQVQFETGEPYGLPLAQCEEVMSEAARLLERGGSAPLGSGLSERIGTDPNDGWIWNEDRADDIFSRTFRDVVRDNYPDLQAGFPDADDLNTLAGALDILARLVPSSSRSALNHTHLALVFRQEGSWGGRVSSSEYRIAGTIFLNRTLFSNPWRTAEHLLHESLHQQLYDFRAGHTLLRPENAREGAPLVHSPWNKPDATRSNYWDIHRVLAAFHVYVHLALLSSLARRRVEEFGQYGPVGIVGTRTALVRAQYLLQQLRGVGADELGPAGTRLVEWFAGTLALLDDSPPAPGAHVHLLLDRYWREAKEFEARLRTDDKSALSARIPALTEREIDSTRSVLRLVGRDAGSFDAAVDGAPKEDLASRFLSVRTAVARTLLGSCDAGYVLSKGGEAEALVSEMVEDSSAILSELVGA